MTKVVNLRKEKYDIYIGRENRRYKLKRSIWSNPFKIGMDGTREEVIEKYRRHITEMMYYNPDLRIDLLKLKGKILGCWCKPKACHGDIIIELLRELEE